MKRQVSFAVLLCCLFALVSSCEKAPLLVINTPGSINFTEQGGAQMVSFTANRDWTVSSSESWCKVSPSSGSKADSELSFTITCDPNTTYDPRNATVTIKAEELMESITVTQDTNLGMLVSQTSYSVSSAEQTIEVEVKANVNYIVDIPSDCKDWISHISTKSLTSRTLVLKISENKDYDDRTGHVTIRQTDGPLAETITINQKQADGLFITTPEYELSNDAHSLSVEVKANVQYTVEIDNEAKEWISLVTTKSLTESAVNLLIAKNDGYERTGNVTLKYENLQEVIIIKQKCGDVVFDDAFFKAYCVQNFDKDNDGEVSLNEANLVEKIDILNQFDIKSVGGIEFFTNLRIFNIVATRNVSYINLSKNTALTELNCEYNQLTSLDVSNNTLLTKLLCSDNLITSLDVSKNTALTLLHCFANHLTSLDVSKNTVLTELNCCNNQLTNLDVSKNTVLSYLDCGGNPLTNLDVSNNTMLTDLSCWGNQLTSLDVSKNTALSVLGCYYNQLTSLDVSKNTALTVLLCDNNRLTSLDVSQNIALSSLGCFYNRLTSLDVSKNIALTQLSCSNNRLADLDVGNNTSLTTLACQDNRLTSLDVSNNTVLNYLGCTNNLIKSLDVSNNTLLTYLYCENNRYLREIWLKTNQVIKYFMFDESIATIKYKD